MKNFKYHINETQYLIRHQKIGTALMVLSMVVMLLFLSTVLSAVYISDEVVRTIEGEAEIDVYFSGENDISIRTRIEAMGEGIYTTLVPREEAYEKMQALLGEDQTLLSYFEDNPFDAYIEVNVPIDEAVRLVGQIEKLNGVTYVRDNQTVLNGIETLSNTLTKAGGLILVGVAMGTFLIIAGVIRQSVYLYGDQIQTMRLLGAPKRFIEVPFYMEGMILTLFSGAIAILIHLFWYQVIYKRSVSGLMMLQMPTDMNLFYKVAGLTIIFSAVVGLFGSYFGIKTSTLKS